MGIAAIPHPCARGGPALQPLFFWSPRLPAGAPSCELLSKSSRAPSTTLLSTPLSPPVAASSESTQPGKALGARRRGRSSPGGRARSVGGRVRSACGLEGGIGEQLPKAPRRARRLPDQQAATILGLLCEGASIRAIQRLTGAEQRTILRLLVDLGTGCEQLLSETIQDVPVQ